MKYLQSVLAIAALANSAFVTSAQAEPTLKWNEIVGCTAVGLDGEAFRSFELNLGVDAEGAPIAIKGRAVQQGHVSEGGEYIHGWQTEISGKVDGLVLVQSEDDSKIFNFHLLDGKADVHVEGDVQSNHLGMVSFTLVGGQLIDINVNGDSPQGKCKLSNQALLERNASIEIPG